MARRTGEDRRNNQKEMKLTKEFNDNNKQKYPKLKLKDIKK